MKTLSIVWKGKATDESALCKVEQQIGFVTSEVTGFMKVNSTTRVGDTMELHKEAVVTIKVVPPREQWKGYGKLVITQPAM